MSKVLVTGGCGFIGSHIADALRKEGYEVAVADIRIDKKSFLPRVSYANEGARYFYCDIRNWNAVKKLFDSFRPRYVIHCAALTRIQPSLKNPRGTYKTNVLGTQHILEASRCFGAEKVVYSASSSAYGGIKELFSREDMPTNPLNPYACSKLIGEMLVSQYANDFGLKACSLRYFNVYGSRQPEIGAYATVVGIFLRQWFLGKPFTVVPDGHQRRDFTWVGDVVRANMLAMESDCARGGEIINIGAGKNYSIFEIADIIGGKDYPKEIVSARQGEVRASLADNEKARKLLNWRPETPFEKGIEIIKKEFKK